MKHIFSHDRPTRTLQILEPNLVLFCVKFAVGVCVCKNNGEQGALCIL